MAEDASTASHDTYGWVGTGVLAIGIAVLCIIANGNLVPHCGLAGAGFFGFARKRKGSQETTAVAPGGEEHVSDQDRVPHQPSLFFDDYQAPADGLQGKSASEEHHVVPSTKTGKPVSDKPEGLSLDEAEVLDFFDIDTEVQARDAEPRSEFHTLIDRVLLVLKSVLFCNTAAYFWLNRERQQLVLEGVATDSPAFTGQKRLSLADDILSQVATLGKPRILTSVDPQGETDLLRYYESAAGVRSAIAVPVFYRNEAQEVEPVGVLVADSTAEDAFGQETIDTLGKFTKLTSALIKSYTDKYDLLSDAELLSSIRRLQDAVKSESGEQRILTALVDEVGRLAAWDYLTITMYAEDAGNWVIQRVVNHTGSTYVLPSQVVDAGKSIVGEAITSNRVEVVPDLSSDDRPRFHAGESIAREGSYVAIPISSYQRCYGAIGLEVRKDRSLTGSEIEVLYRLVEIAGSALEVGYMNDLVKEFASVEHLTGLTTRKFFMRRVDEEVMRADDNGGELAYATLGIDGLDEQIRRYGREIQDVIFRSMNELIRKNLRPYDVLGRQDGNVLGVLLTNMTASDAYLWAEKLRKAIAGHAIVYGQRSISVTVSFGICGLSERMSARELVAGATQVYGKSLESGGNAVRVF
jgi:diguanylate cyclase (GGDEF)-like protein